MTTILEEAAGVAPGSPLAEALDARRNILAMTQEVHRAALTPDDPGGLSHALRAAIAARVSRFHKDSTLEKHYRALLESAGTTDALSQIAEGGASDDAHTAALLAYADLAAKTPREMTEADIAALQSAGVADADIVRLAELIAFLAYQLRVAAALRLMGQST